MAPVIEVLIGLLLVYLILSLIVSAIHEGLAGIFGWRSTYLERGIANLLGVALSRDFFNHDLVRGLRNEAARLPWNRKPSYISASTFTETVLDFVRKAQPPPGPASGGSALSVQTNDQVLRELRERLTTGRVGEAEAPVLGEALRIFSEAAKNLDDFKEKVDAWFEEAMDRVSGWYKRFTRLLLFLIGVALVFLLNADTISITTSLWRNAPIRTAIVEQAGRVARGEEPDAEAAQNELRQLEELQLPLGWRTGRVPEGDPRALPRNLGEAGLKFVGLVITAFALSFGAPFWFDLLKKFVGVRSSGAEPQPAQTGPPSGAAEEPARLDILPRDAAGRARRKPR